MFNASIMIWLSVGISLCLPIIHLTIVLLTFLVLLYPLGDYTMCPSWKGGNGLTDILVAGIIWPSYSALGTVFFFPSLRIRTKLRPCIDFRGLNKITARYNTHCLYCPLLLSCYTTIFSKLNLLVRIREWGEWKTTNPLGGFGCCFSGPGKWCRLGLHEPLCVRLLRWHSDLLTVSSRIHVSCTASPT